MEKINKVCIFDRVRNRIEDKDPNVSLIALSTLTNSVTALLKIFFGMYLGSFWLVLHAVYFMIIGFARYRTMKNYIYVQTVKDVLFKYNMEFETHNKAGGFLVFIGLTYLFACLRMYLIGDVILIGGILVYWFIVFTGFKFLFAIYGMITTRSKRNPIIRTMKVIGFVDASVSVVPTLYTTLSFFKYENTAEITSLLGMGISIGVMIAGVVMYNRKKRVIDENNASEYVLVKTMYEKSEQTT
ncbi:MAG: hypothetical protein MJ166_02495 [Clostridia bacterium]|nr:hypothetical protein [Clostridia bacterium]